MGADCSGRRGLPVGAEQCSAHLTPCKAWRKQGLSYSATQWIVAMWAEQCSAPTRHLRRLSILGQPRAGLRFKEQPRHQPGDRGGQQQPEDESEAHSNLNGLAAE